MNTRTLWFWIWLICVCIVVIFIESMPARAASPIGTVSAADGLTICPQDPMTVPAAAECRFMVAGYLEGVDGTLVPTKGGDLKYVRLPAQWDVPTMLSAMLADWAQLKTDARAQQMSFVQFLGAFAATHYGTVVKAKRCAGEFSL
jgi:hypothetical protein